MTTATTMQRLEPARLERMLAEHAAFAEDPEHGRMIEFVGCDVSGADFSNLDLSGVYFQHCRFADCVFAATNLCDANLSDCSFVNVDFTAAVLIKSEWFRCDARACRFDRARAGSATFIECDLAGASFLGADLDHTHFGVKDPTAIVFDPGR